MAAGIIQNTVFQHFKHFLVDKFEKKSKKSVLKQKQIVSVCS